MYTYYVIYIVWTAETIRYVAYENIATCTRTNKNNGKKKTEKILGINRQALSAGLVDTSALDISLVRGCVDRFAASATCLQFLVQICFSSTLLKLIFAVLLVYLQLKRKHFFSCAFKLDI